MQCNLKASSKLPSGMYGAKSRYDDFTVVHMNTTPSVHSTANFMHWHHYNIWTYEIALHTQCAHKGFQPYWDCADYVDIVNSPRNPFQRRGAGGKGAFCYVNQ
jgi:tyrosinase